MLRMKNPVAERIQQRLDDLGLNQTSAAKRVGKTRELLRGVLSGKARFPTAENLALIAEALETTPEWLLEGKGEPAATDRAVIANTDHFFEDVVTVPRLGTAAAGIWLEFDHHQNEPGETRSRITPHPSYPPEAQFSVVIEGNSLNMRFAPGTEFLCVDLGVMGWDLTNLKTNDLVLIQRVREDDGTFEYAVKYVYLNFDMDRIEFRAWSTDPSFSRPLVLPDAYSNAPDKEELIKIKEYEAVYVKAKVIDFFGSMNGHGPF